MMLRNSFAILIGCGMLNSCSFYKTIVRHRDPVGTRVLEEQKMILDGPSQEHQDILHKQEEQHQRMLDILRNQ